MSDQAQPTTDSFRLARYVVLLVLDPARLEDYVNYPGSREAEMRAAGLSEKEIELLSAEGFVNLCEYLEKQVPSPAPVPDDQTQGGGG